MASKTEPAWVKAADRASIWAVTIGALIVAALILIGFTVTTIGQLSSGEVSFPVITETAVPAGEFGQDKGITSATYTEAEVTAGGLSTFPFAAFIAANAVNTLTALIVALALAFMGWRWLKGDPFRTSVIYSGIAAAIALMLGPFVALLLSTTATTRALLEIAGPKEGRPDLIFAAEFNLAPFLAGVGLAVVLGIFEAGQKLKADTEGLV
jgi:hypothetical protein